MACTLQFKSLVLINTLFSKDAVNLIQSNSKDLYIVANNFISIFFLNFLFIKHKKIHKKIFSIIISRNLEQVTILE